METLSQILLERITLWIPHLATALVLFVVFWVLANLTARAIKKGARHIQQDAQASCCLLGPPRSR